MSQTIVMPEVIQSPQHPAPPPVAFSIEKLKQARVTQIFEYSVHKCIVHCTIDSVEFVVKRLNSRLQREYTREVKALLACRNEHALVNKLWFYEVDAQLNCTMVMPWAQGGTLNDWMQKINRPAHLDEVHFYLLELTEALHYVHHCDVIHHDVKVSNVLLGLDGHVVLADFGNARHLCLGERTINAWRNQAEHMPMEIHSDILNYPTAPSSNYINHSVDWFSLGVLLYYLAFGQLPYTKPLIPENAPFVVTFPSSTEDGLTDVIGQLLCLNADIRLGASSRDGFEVLSHEWVCNYRPEVWKIWKKKGSEGLSDFIRHKGLTTPALLTA